MDRQQETNEIEELQAFLDRARPYFGTEREKTFFEVGMRGHYENPTTELLQFFIDPQNQHGLGDAFYRGLLSALELDEAECGAVLSVDTEVVTASGGRIDLLISTDSCIIAIECKIYHFQVNPFEEYVEHVRQLCQENGKQPIYMILCIGGNSSQSEWRGVPYRNLVECTKSFLAESLLDNPMNKWGILAREFLIHLERFGENRMNEDRFEFIKENLASIKKAKDMEEEFLNEIKRRVAGTLNNESLVSKIHNWREGPALRFSLSSWESQSDVVFLINISQAAPSFYVISYIQDPIPDFVEAFKSIWGTEIIATNDSRWWQFGLNDPLLFEEAMKAVPKAINSLDAAEKLRIELKPSL